MQEQAQRIIDTKRTAKPMSSYMWYMELPANIDGFTEGDVFEINSRIVSVSNPYHTLETDKEIDGNSFWYYAKSIDIGSITLEIMEHEDGKSLEYFTKWKEMIANGNGTFNAPYHYKRTINLYRLDVQRRKMHIDQYTGYFVSAIGDVTNDYESNGFLKYTITLTGDDVVHLNTPNADQSFTINEQTEDLTTATNVFITGKEFINKVKNARISKKSLVDLLL